MALSEAAKTWFNRHGLEGFLRIAEAPPHEEPEKVALRIDLEEITEDVVRALIGLLEGGLYSIENPSTETLTEYFGEDALFREIASVLHEYGFMHPQPLAMPKNKARFIIATNQGEKVDWLVIIADSLRVANAIGWGWEEGLDRDDAVVNTFRTTSANHQSEEAGPTGRYNANQAIQVTTTPSQAYFRMDRGRIGTKRNRAPKELDGEGTRAVKEFGTKGEGKEPRWKQ